MFGYLSTVRNLYLALESRHPDSRGEDHIHHGHIHLDREDLHGHGLLSYREGLYAWERPYKPNVNRHLIAADDLTNLKLSPSENAVVENECLGNEIGLGKFDVRIPAEYH